MYRIWNLLLSLNLQSQLDYVLEMINSYGWLCEINNQTVISISWECFGEGNGKPLQYSYLENPMDGGAIRLQPIGVAMSWIQLSDFTFTFHFHTLEKEMATHSSVLAWRIPGMAEPGRLPSMGSHRVGHDWSDLAAAAAESVLPMFSSRSFIVSWSFRSFIFVYGVRKCSSFILLQVVDQFSQLLPLLSHFSHVRLCATL